MLFGQKGIPTQSKYTQQNKFLYQGGEKSLERWIMLEARNERLFEILGAVANEVKTNPETLFSVNEVLEILEAIAYGEVKGEK